jgi:hypothetical protein
MADEVWEFGAKGGVDGHGDCSLDDAGNVDVRKGNALADEEGARREVAFKGVECTGVALNEAGVCLVGLFVSN